MISLIFQLNIHHRAFQTAYVYINAFVIKISLQHRLILNAKLEWKNSIQLSRQSMNSVYFKWKKVSLIEFDARKLVVKTQRRATEWYASQFMLIQMTNLLTKYGEKKAQHRNSDRLHLRIPFNWMLDEIIFV